MFPKDPLGPLDRFYTIEEVAQGFLVSERTIRRWIATRGLRAHKVRSGEALMIKGVDLALFVKAREENRSGEPG